MAGLITNKEAESRLNSNTNFLTRVIHGELKRKPQRARSSYDEKVKIAAEAITTSAKEVMAKYDYSQKGINDIIHGKTNSSNGQTRIDEKFIDDVKTKVIGSRDAAVNILAASLGLITNDELAALDVTDRVDVASKMAKMVEILTPNGNMKVPSVLIIAAPEIKALNDIPDVFEGEVIS